MDIDYRNRLLGGMPATYSKSAERFPANYPSYIMNAVGATVKCNDGNNYIDTISGLGATILGHEQLLSSSRFREEISSCGSYSLPHRLEYVAAQAISDRFNKESVRFVKNGADALQGAVRLARHLTGKRYVLCNGYHGMHDWYISGTQSNAGVMEDYRTVRFDILDLEELSRLEHRYRGDIAAIVIEPPMIQSTDAPALRRSIEYIQELTHDEEFFFILDECVTACRYFVDDEKDFGLGFANAKGIVPDLVCISKGVANGYPISAICGAYHHMRHFNANEVFCSTTFGGETAGLTALIHTLEMLDLNSMRTLKRLGNMYKDAMTDILKELPCTLLGDYARMMIRWEGEDADLYKTAWMSEHVKHGILYGVPIFPMICWTHHIVSHLTESAELVVKEIIANKDDLIRIIPEGKIASDVFKRYDN